MSWCETCTNTDGAECIGCQGWRKGAAPTAPRRLLDDTSTCACGDIERQGWVHRQSYCWPYDERAAGVSEGEDTLEDVVRATAGLVDAARGLGATITAGVAIPLTTDQPKEN